MTATVGPLLFTHTGTLYHQWEITDDNYTRSELVRQARPELDQYITDHGVTLVGPESWVVEGEAATALLIVTAPAMWNQP